MRKALQRLLAEEPRIEVVGTATSGEELLENLDRWRPDFITLDLSMPGMGGMLTLDRIMATRPMPVIILSTHSSKDAPWTIEALHRGAVDFIDKQQFSLMDFHALRETLVEKILGVAEGRKPPRPNTPFPPSDTTRPLPPLPPSAGHFDAVFMGASTGGPPVLQRILEAFGGPLPAPLLIVQHMPLGFTKSFADRLNAHLPMPVHEAAHTESLVPGTVYIAPSGHHLRVKRECGHPICVLTRFPENVAHRPSVDVLFESAVEVFGRRALGVLLTGMGKDGAEGLKGLARAGAYTIGQNESSCVVYGMPKAAAQLGAVRCELSDTEIGPQILRLLKGTPTQ